MRRFFSAQIAVLIFVLGCYSQEQTEESILSVLDSKWERVRIAGQKADSIVVPPARGLTPNDKYYQRASGRISQRAFQIPVKNLLTAAPLRWNAAFRKLAWQNRTM